MEEKLIKSKERVAVHGEVFTPAWMVEAMLDLVKGFETIPANFVSEVIFLLMKAHPPL